MPIPTVDSEFNLRLKAEDELYRWRQRADRRLELLRDALEFIDGMSLAEAALRIEIRKELDNA